MAAAATGAAEVVVTGVAEARWWLRARESMRVASRTPPGRRTEAARASTWRARTTRIIPVAIRLITCHTHDDDDDDDDTGMAI